MASTGGPAVACSRADRRAIRLLAARLDCSCVVVIHAMLAGYLDRHPDLRALVEQAEGAASRQRMADEILREDSQNPGKP